MKKGRVRKITVNIPEELLNHATQASGKGVTETVRHGLKLVAAAEAYKKLRSFRGKVKFSLDLAALREDRDKVAVNYKVRHSDSD